MPKPYRWIVSHRKATIGRVYSEKPNDPQDKPAGFGKSVRSLVAINEKCPIQCHSSRAMDNPRRG